MFGSDGGGNPDGQGTSCCPTTKDGVLCKCDVIDFAVPDKDCKDRSRRAEEDTCTRDQGQQDDERTPCYPEKTDEHEVVSDCCGGEPDSTMESAKCCSTTKMETTCCSVDEVSNSHAQKDEKKASCCSDEQDLCNEGAKSCCGDSADGGLNEVNCCGVLAADTVCCSSEKDDHNHNQADEEQPSCSLEETGCCGQAATGCCDQTGRAPKESDCCGGTDKKEASCSPHKVDHEQQYNHDTHYQESLHRNHDAHDHGATIRATGRDSEKTRHHHHQLRMRATASRKACAEHTARVSDIWTSLKKQQKHPVRPTSSTTSLQAYFEDCFCRVIDRLLKSSSNPLIIDAISTFGCCTSKEAKKVKTVCCTKSHRIRSPGGTYRRLGSGREVQPIKKEDEVKIRAADITDPEKGATRLLHLSLSISGMTCSGCVAKLNQTLGRTPGVRKESIKSSFVLNRTDFLYDPAIIPGKSKDLIALIKTKSGFTATLIDEFDDDGGEIGTKLHLLMTNEAKVCLETSNLDGVLSVRPNLTATTHDTVADIQLQIFTIIYDAQRIGARQILAAGQGGMKLPEYSEFSLEHSEIIAARVGKTHLRNMVALTLACAILTIPVVAVAFGDFGLSRSTINAITFSLATVVQILSWNMYVDAYKSVRYQHELDMNCLVILSTTSAYLYSVAAMGVELHSISRNTESLLTEPFFEASTLLITLILIGRVMTLFVRIRASKVGQSISSLQERSACLSNTAGTEQTIDIRLLQYNDILVAKDGDKIVTDGVVHGTGVAEIDESLLTGEPALAIRKRGSPVLAGSTIVHGTCHYRVTRLVHENSISATKKLITSAASSKSRTQEISDRISAVLVPTVLATATIVFIVWAVTQRNSAPQPTVAKACITALTYTIAVLAVSCPCAIGLAVPMVLVVGSSVGMKSGVVFRAASAVEKGSRVQDVIFDKTGTLTLGRMKVYSERYFDVHQLEAKQIVATLIRGNRHPVSTAIHEHLRHVPTSSAVKLLGEVENIVGKGIAGTIDGYVIKGGKPDWLGSVITEHPALQDIQNHALTPFVVIRYKESDDVRSEDIQLVAAFGLDDALRPEASAIITLLKSKGLQVHLLSGDQPAVVNRVATELGFPLSQVRGSCSPESKADYIREIQKTNTSSRLSRIFQYSSKPSVLFIGDGSNDAVALTQADVGMSMCHATDIAAGAADVGILSDNLAGLPAFIRLSKCMYATIWFNMTWALLYNVFAILLAGGAFEAVGVRIEPSYAGLGEIVSVLPVIMASIVLVKIFGRAALNVL